MCISVLGRKQNDKTWFVNPPLPQYKNNGSHIKRLKIGHDVENWDIAQQFVNSKETGQLFPQISLYQVFISIEQ